VVLMTTTAKLIVLRRRFRRWNPHPLSGAQIGSDSAAQPAYKAGRGGDSAAQPVGGGGDPPSLT